MGRETEEDAHFADKLEGDASAAKEQSSADRFNFLSSNGVHDFRKGLLPSVHFDHLDALDNLVHESHSFVRLLGRFPAKVRSFSTHPAWDRQIEEEDEVNELGWRDIGRNSIYTHPAEG